MESESRFDDLRELVYSKIHTDPRYSSLGEKIKTYMKAGELANQRRKYDLAYHCFGCAAYHLKESNLKLLSKKYRVLAGDAAAKEGGAYYNQEAGFAYGYAGDKRRVDEHLIGLGYEPENVRPSTWMAHARFLAKINEGGYEYGR